MITSAARMLPIWRGERPDWVPNRGGPHWAVLALQDHGDEPLEFGVNHVPWPLGINTGDTPRGIRADRAVRQQAGTEGGDSPNQAQREWHLRARAAGLRGFYVPDMVVHHVVENSASRSGPFRRWFYWHGISRAILFRILG